MSKKAEKKQLEKAAKRLKKAEKKAQKAKRESAAPASEVSPEQRLEMIATAAYFHAERHGFTPGESEADWRAAEREIDELLQAEGKRKKKKKKKKS